MHLFLPLRVVLARCCKETSQTGSCTGDQAPWWETAHWIQTQRETIERKRAHFGHVINIAFVLFQLRCSSPAGSFARHSRWTAQREESAQSLHDSHLHVPLADRQKDRGGSHKMLVNVQCRMFFSTDTGCYWPRQSGVRSSATPSPEAPGSPWVSGSVRPAWAWPERWAELCGPSHRCSEPPRTSFPTRFGLQCAPHLLARATQNIDTRFGGCCTFKGLLHPKRTIVINHLPPCRSQPVKALFVFGSLFKIFWMKTGRLVTVPLTPR